MIVVVEGVGAAGKTTWCTRHATAVVPELAPLVPPEGDATEVAQFWTKAHCGRWRRAEQMEQELGMACCDTDPLKLHYPWCLWRLGYVSAENWRAAVAATRAAMVARELGFADVVLFLDPEASVVRRQRENDPTRHRRNFERHLLLGVVLREWYEALEQLCPNRVVWHGERVNEVIRVPPKADRYSIELFDELVALAGRRDQ